jgi:hypothetical protein
MGVKRDAQPSDPPPLEWSILKYGF